MMRMLPLLLLFLMSCMVKPELPSELPYELESPDNQFKLTAELLEISGLTWVREGIIACVEDNTGRSYYFDLAGEKVYHVETITTEGDFEGIAKTETSMFLARSDGSLFEWDRSVTKEHKTFLSKKTDVEGLCYDSIGNRLIVACKGDIEGLSNNERAFYSFDLSTSKLSEEPAWTISLSQFEKYFGERAEDFRFKPSGIALHPLTKEFYIISSTGKILLITNREGNITDAAWLPEHLFPQPEGICFSPNGDMYISTEGKSLEPPKIFRYKMRQD